MASLALRLLRRSLAPASLGLTAACSPLLEAHGGPVAPLDVSTRQTFSTGAPDGAPPGFVGSPRTTEVARRVAVVATRVLQARGYTLAAPPPASSDLRLDVRVGRRDEKLAPVFPMPLPRGSFAEATEAEDARVGALVLDVYDVASGLLVWHGAASVVVDTGAIDDALIERATTAILGGFPARR